MRPSRRAAGRSILRRRFGPSRAGARRHRAVYKLARRLHDPLPTVRLSERRIRFALGEIEEWAARQRRRVKR